MTQFFVLDDTSDTSWSEDDDFRSDPGDNTAEDKANRSERTVFINRGVQTWTPGFGSQIVPAGEPFLMGGDLRVPTLTGYEEGFTNYDAASLTDWKLKIELANIEDLMAVTYLQFPHLVPTVAGKYRMAAVHPFTGTNFQGVNGRRTDGTRETVGDGLADAGRNGWGRLSDYQGEFFSILRHESKLITQVQNANQVICVDEAGAFVWRRDGWNNFPAAAAIGPLDDNKNSAIWSGNINGTSLEWDQEIFNVIGPGRSGTILVHVETHKIGPQIYPKWLEESYNTNVDYPAYFTGTKDPAEVPYDMDGGWRPRWLQKTYDGGLTFNQPMGNNPAFHPRQFGDGSTCGVEVGNPLYVNVPGNSAGGDPVQTYRFRNLTNAIAAATGDMKTELEALLNMPGFWGWYCYDVRHKIEEWDVNTGLTLSAFDVGALAARVDLQQSHLRGTGMVTQVQGAPAWVQHPDFPVYDPGEPPATTGFWLPPDLNIAGKEGGREVNSWGPGMFLHFFREGPEPVSGNDYGEILSTDSNACAGDPLNPGGIYVVHPAAGPPPSNLLDAADWLTTYVHLDQAQGVQATTTIDRPGPFHTGKVAVAEDGSIYVFGARSKTTNPSYEDFDTNQTAWNAEVTRLHEIRAIEPNTMNTLWTFNTTVHAGEVFYDAPSVAPAGTYHPGSGDVVSNLVLTGNGRYVTFICRGSRGHVLTRLACKEIVDGMVTLYNPGDLVYEKVLDTDNGMFTDSLTTHSKPIVCEETRDVLYDNLFVVGDEVRGLGRRSDNTVGLWRLVAA